MTKYKVCFFGSIDFSTEKVECFRETAQSVWVERFGRQRRNAKESSWEFYADSESAAKEWFIGKLRDKLREETRAKLYAEEQIPRLAEAIRKLEGGRR